MPSRPRPIGSIRAARSLRPPGAAAEALGADAGGVTADPRGGGGVPWLLLLLIIGIPLVLLWVLWRSVRKQRERATASSAEEIGAAETKVRSAVDKVANDLLELADRTDLPDVPAEARSAFSQGAQLFTETQELLEEADTRPELEAAYREVVKAGWHMDTTRALLAGQPAPPEPEPEPLFPEPVVVAAPAGTPAGQLPGGMEAPRAEPQYRKPDMSPWITAAAMAAMAMLSRRGMAQPQTRLPMDDDVFGQWARRTAAVAVKFAIVGRDVRWRQERGPGGHAERTQSWPGTGRRR
jgi:hypothetical protein